MDGEAAARQLAPAWNADAAHGSWRLLVDGRIAAVVVHHSDGWRGFLNPSGQEVRNSPHLTLEAAQEAVVAALGGGDELGS